jgi:hypothetical protein
LWRIIVRIVTVAHLTLMRPPLKLAIAADGRSVFRGPLTLGANRLLDQFLRHELKARVARVDS